MSPLEPRDDRAADRHDGGARQGEDEAYDLVVAAPRVHLDALQHVTGCARCLRTMWLVFSDAELRRELELEPV